MREESLITQLRPRELVGNILGQGRENNDHTHSRLLDEANIPRLVYAALQIWNPVECPQRCRIHFCGGSVTDPDPYWNRIQ